MKNPGIHYSPTLCSFGDHIDSIVGKPLKVRSLLNYGSVIWHPYLARDQLRLERVQNKFLAYAALVLKLPDPCHDYTYLRKVLTGQSLQFRRSNVNQNVIVALIDGLLDAPERYLLQSTLS
ncbi:Hypothetical protein CINCED_3A024441 [Cinara cedri]|uniref:Uncharacterized protein n=1 Tax=Cinara cedri TaxID=506608 RepID=A0A5E4N712_9HEMI|nr:Hypothetical protein CINCED_3A024441 [Cinara cedri]